MPQVYLHQEFRRVTRRDWRKKKTDGFAVRLESSADILVCGFTGLSCPVLNWRLESRQTRPDQSGECLLYPAELPLLATQWPVQPGTT